MKRLILTPHVGIGPIKLGAARKDIRAAMSAAGLALESSRESMDYFSSASIQVEYQEDDTASFIGVSSDADLELVWDGVDLFDVEAERVFELFARSDGSGSHEYSENEHLFSSQIITLYDADAQYDRKREETRSIWGQIGCGDSRYLKAVQK